MNIKSKKDIYLFHIPKTAGTSLGGMIRSVYDKEDILTYDNYEEGKFMKSTHWSELERKGRAEINGFKCFTGHYGTTLYDILDREMPTVTILRDPFERTVSHIRHTQKIVQSATTKLHGNHMLKHFTGWLNTSPFLFLLICNNIKIKYGNEASSKDFINAFLRDTQTRLLGTDITLAQVAENRHIEFYETLLHKVQAETSMETVLERAKRRLDSMVVVGTVERFAESTQLIFEYLGMPVPEKLRESNVAAGHKPGTRYRDSSIASPRFVKWVDSFTQYDRQLYDYANQLLDRQLANRPHSTGSGAPKLVPSELTR